MKTQPWQETLSLLCQTVASRYSGAFARTVPKVHARSNTGKSYRFHLFCLLKASLPKYPNLGMVSATLNKANWIRLGSEADTVTFVLTLSVFSGHYLKGEDS